MLVSTILVLIIASSSVNAQQKCRALVLQGGGDKGAYEAGVFYGFITNAKNPEDFEYDVITGVSVGALNGLSIAQFDKGQELDAANFIKGIWTNTSQSDIFKPWPGGILEGVFEKQSIFDTTPEQDYIKAAIRTIPNKRKITTVTTDFDTGNKVTFSEDSWHENVGMAVNAAMFSSAVPFVFAPRHYQNSTYIDGGWSGAGLDVEDAVTRCREIVTDDSDIIIDIIFAGNYTQVDVRAQSYTTLQMLSRFVGIYKYVFNTRALDYARVYYPTVDFRYVMVASQKLPNQDLPIDFKQENIQFMLNLGIQDAITALNEGPGKGMERFLAGGKRYKNNF